MNGSTVGMAFVAALSAVSVGVYRHFVEDRVPWISRALTVVAAAGLAFFGVWAAMEAPDLLLFSLAAFAVINLLDGFVSTSPRLPAQPAHPHVWVEPMAGIRQMGWVHIGTWQLQLGGKYPELAIYDRPDGKVRVFAIGTASQGGVVEVQSLLDDGRGIVTTLNKRSRLIRPPWMFKQSLKDAPILDLVRAHEEALHYLEVMGVTPSAFPPDHPIDGMRREHRMIRDYFKRRWWLVAIQPVAAYLTPSRSRPLHQQADIDRQIDGYHESAPVPPRSTGR